MHTDEKRARMCLFIFFAWEAAVLRDGGVFYVLDNSVGWFFFCYDWMSSNDFVKRVLFTIYLSALSLYLPYLIFIFLRRSGGPLHILLDFCLAF